MYRSCAPLRKKFASGKHRRAAYFGALRTAGLSDRPVHMATLEERTDDIRAVMDDANFIPLPDGEGNLLELVKRRKKD